MDLIAKLRKEDGGEADIEVAQREELANALEARDLSDEASMDEVRYEQRGTVVHMRKRFTARADAEREVR